MMNCYRSRGTAALRQDKDPRLTCFATVPLRYGSLRCRQAGRGGVELAVMLHPRPPVSGCVVTKGCCMGFRGVDTAATAY